MVVLCIALLFGVFIVGLSLRANNRFRHASRLPMQWSLSGVVNWSAPRAVALSFIPATAGVVLTLFVFLALNVKPRTGQENMVLPVLMTIGSTYIAVQFLHHRLIAKSLRDGSN